MLGWPWFRRTTHTTIAASAEARNIVIPAYSPADRPAITPPLTSIGGRLSTDTSNTFFGSPHVILPPQSTTDQWEMIRLDDDRMGRLSPIQLIEVLSDLSPDMSRALWDFLRLCNPGYTITVLDKKGGNLDPVGQKMVEDFILKLDKLYGSADVVINRMFMAAFIRGAFFTELVLDLDGRTMVDLATPDPASIRFIRSEDPVRGMIWQLAQWQNRPAPPGQQQLAGFVTLDWPTIQYIPIDPFPGIPYGRAIAAPAIFSTCFLLGMLHDLRRVISQQGYPRLDISINIEKLKTSMPNSVLKDPVLYKEWCDRAISEVESSYRNLRPDSTFVHTDVAEMNRPQGTVDSSSLGAIDGLIEALERMNTRALKTMPFMMASTQTTTETLANREWEVQTAGIASLQVHGETQLETQMMLGCQAQGHPCWVEWEFDALRATEALRDAQVDTLKIQNEINKYVMGIKTLDQVAQCLEGHDAVLPEPLYIPKTLVPFNDLAAGTQADGSHRSELEPVNA